ncbi:MAG: SPOR domain-containing protein [Sphingomonadaceae bacterium]|nr:SPOR domain-containing protein [Sphingomonadaceae bacterium]
MPFVRLLRSALLGGAVLSLSAPAALAARQQQDDGELDAVSQPVVQPIPGAPGMRLNEALGRLARNPRDVDALVDAGKAAAAIGDAEAAIGFYRRADQLRPGNANIKAGLASALVLSEDPFSAIPLYREAESAGAIDPAYLAERGLAYDLVGDNETAQRHYRQSLAGRPDDEILRRLALSQAISGDRRGMEVTLSPLLQKQDKAAWRTRAFAFAILGQQAEAEAIARANLPEGAVDTMVSYLRFMPRLTPAQQAAAANLGHFPRAAEIGRDDPRVAAFARPRATLAAAEKPAAASVPPARSERPTRQPRTRSAVSGTIVGSSRSTPPEPQPVRMTVTPQPSVTPQPGVTSVPVRAAAVVPPPAPAPTPAPAPSPTPTLAPAPAPVQVAANTAPVVPIVAPAPAPPPAPPPAPTPAPRARSLADVFADLSPPSREVQPPPGAVDVRRLAATEASAQKPGITAKGRDTKSPAATQPSRIWVQLAASRDKAGLRDDFRRFARQEPDLFKGRKGFTSAWGQATRLLTGPFDSERAADAFLAKVKKAKVADGFVWTSPAGQVVDPLPAPR